MITDPPILTIRRNFPRPAADLVAALTGVSTGFVVDTMGGRGGLDARIKPLVAPAAPLVGVALTCDNGPADNLGLFAALDVARAGDIIVAATNSYLATALTGDLLLGMAKNCGVAGLVTDGAIRDLPGVLAVGLPVFCAGITPNSPVRNGPGSVGLPVVLGGVSVESGDIVVADQDGVVIVPQRGAPRVVELLVEVRAAEARMDAAVKAGLKIPDFLRNLLASGRVEELP